MPKVELIAVSAVPSVARAVTQVAQTEAKENLQKALRGNQALALTLEVAERSAWVTNAYRRAAKDLGIAILVVGVEPRTYTGLHNIERTEFGKLYIRITKASTQVAPKSAPLTQPRAEQPAPTPLRDDGMLPRRPIQIPPDRIEREPITGALVSR